jgi:hypothetical protein
MRVKLQAAAVRTEMGKRKKKSLWQRKFPGGQHIQDDTVQVQARVRKKLHRMLKLSPEDTKKEFQAAVSFAARVDGVCSGRPP